MSEDTRRRIKPWLCHQPKVELGDAVWRPVAADVAMALAVDVATGVRLVTGEEAAAWPDTTDELFAVARGNLGGEPAPVRERLNDEVTVFRGDSQFVAARVLTLDELLAEPAEYGAVVAVPTRQTLLVHAIRDLGVVDAFVPMLQATQLLWGRGTDAVSNQLFWCRHGLLQRLPVPGMGNGHGGTTPRDFRRLLLSLPPRRAS